MGGRGYLELTGYRLAAAGIESLIRERGDRCNPLTLQRIPTLGLRVPRKMHFHALGQQTFAATLTTPGEGGAPAFGAHAGAKTMLLFPGSLGSL